MNAFFFTFLQIFSFVICLPVQKDKHLGYYSTTIPLAKSCNSQHLIEFQSRGKRRKVAQEKQHKIHWTYQLRSHFYSGNRAFKKKCLVKCFGKEGNPKHEC